MTEEYKRLIRHMMPVLITYAVSKGWIPEEMKGDLIEVGIIVAGLAFSLVWSRKRDTT